MALGCTSKSYRTAVCINGVRHVCTVDLSAKPGTAVGPALSWVLACEGLVNLTTIRAVGSAALPPLRELCAALVAQHATAAEPVQADPATAAAAQAAARRARAAPIPLCDTSLIAPRRVPVPDVGRARLAALTSLSLDSVKQLCEEDLRALLPHTPRELQGLPRRG